MICSIMQPTYFPWLGFFDMIDQSDLFILLDDVQLVKRSWQVRNRIKTASGPIFLSIPIHKTAHRDALTIEKAEISEEPDWKSRHINSMKHAYARSPFFDEVMGIIESLLEKENRHLGEMNHKIITTLAAGMGIKTRIIPSSTLSGIEGKKDERLANICREVGADQYLSPQGSAVYLESESPGGQLKKHGIAVFYHNYEHPVYPQMYGEFIPFMCIIDLLFNVGFDSARKIIISGREKSIPSPDYRKNILKIT